MAHVTRLGLLGAAVIFATTSFVGAASAQSVLTSKVTNNTTVSVTASSPSGCQGTPSPALRTLSASGDTETYTITSPFSTSNGCSIRYTRSDNLRFCNWVMARTRVSLMGAWNFPTINTTSSPSGITCTSSISNVNANGNWTATLTVAP